ncbi:DNA topoisomerase 2-binding protein 1 [Lobulomyces angularis]|nr:DNA topoisomerase 2-binding protein 1 [Lobulomyces angularis]
MEGNLIISLTSVEFQERILLAEKIESIPNCSYSPHLTKHVTLLSTNKTGSEKYKAALELGIPVVSLSFIDEIFKNKNAPNFNPCAIIQNHLLPPLANAVICVTNLSLKEREEVKEMVNNLGGQHSPDLTKNCTHLIAKTPSGRKFEFAKKWKLSIVSLNWLLEVFQKNGWVEEAPFSLVALETTKLIRQFTQTFTYTYFSTIVVYFGADIKADTKKQLTEFIKEGGGVVSKHLLSATHFISESSILHKDDALLLSELSNSEILVVSKEWLYDCQKQRKLLLVDGYISLLENGQYIFESSKLKNLNNKKSIVVRQDRRSNGVSALDMLFKNAPTKIDSEELSNTIQPDVGMLNNPTYVAEDVFLHNNKKIDAEAAERKNNVQNIFEKLKFSANGFNDKECQVLNKEVSLRGGTFLGPYSWQHKEDKIYVIVRFKANLSKTLHIPLKTEIVVTECWIERCINEQRVFSPHESIVFQPLKIKVPIDGFENFFIGISGYDGIERNHISQVCVHLGGKFSETFSKKMTHLICKPGSDSLKLEKAIDWGIPAISLDWITSCAKSGFISSTIPFLNEKLKTQSNQKNKFNFDTVEALEMKHHTPKHNANELPNMSPIDEQFTTNLKKAIINKQNTFFSPKCYGNYTEKKIFPEMFFSDDTTTSFNNNKTNTTAAIYDNKIPLNFDTFSQINLDMVNECFEISKSEQKERRRTKLEPIIDNNFSNPLQSTTQSCNRSGILNELTPSSDGINYIDQNELIAKRKMMEDMCQGESKKGKFSNSEKADRFSNPKEKGEYSGSKIFKNETGNVSNEEYENKKELTIVNYRFMISGIPSNQRFNLKNNIKKLGGFLITDNNDYSCTHLICSEPSNTAACASGAWLLSVKYIDESIKNNKFVAEEEFEWSLKTWPDATGKGRDCVEAGVYWRLQLKNFLNPPRNGIRKGCFEGWVAVLVLENKKLVGFLKVLKSGGAKVKLTTKEVEENSSEITHCFVDSSLSKSVEWEILIDKLKDDSVQILDPSYISNYLHRRM